MKYIKLAPVFKFISEKNMLCSCIIVGLGRMAVLWDKLSGLWDYCETLSLGFVIPLPAISKR
jgi:hypothetical protein